MKNSIDFKKIKNSLLFQIVSVLLILAVLAGIGAGLAIIKHRMDYESVAVKYFSAYLRGDAESMYEYVYVDESEFINYEQFVLKTASERAACSISEYKLNKPVKESGTVTYNVTYENEISEEEETYTITLKKCREKWYHIIPEYKVVVDNKIVNNVTVHIPEGTSLYIDDQLAVNKTTDEDTDTYDIPYMFIGEHTFYVESDFGESTIIQEIQEDNTELSVSVSDISMKISDKTELTNSIGEMIEAFYAAVIDKEKSYKDILSYFPDDGSLNKKVKKCFSKTKDVLYWNSVANSENYKIIDLTFGDIDYDISEFEYPDKAVIVCSFRYEYTASTDTSVLSSYTEQYSGACNTKITINYEASAENGWVMTGIKMSNKNTEN